MRENMEIGIIDERLYECVECGVEFDGSELEYGEICEHCGRELIEVGCDENIHKDYDWYGFNNVDLILEDRRDYIGITRPNTCI